VPSRKRYQEREGTHNKSFVHNRFLTWITGIPGVSQSIEGLNIDVLIDVNLGEYLARLERLKYVLESSFPEYTSTVLEIGWMKR
jgi:hypothetical protein